MKPDNTYLQELDNPYKGLFQYTSKDEILFFGREKETADLVEMIKNSQLVVIYGDSGTGKTSLIKAKLFPELSRQYYFPIYIRFNYLGKTDPLTQLRETIYNELKTWDKQTPSFTPDLTLIEYAAQTSVLNGLVKPILFFDQFEELFTLGQKYIEPKVLGNFIRQLSDLVEMRLPDRKKSQQLIPAASGVGESSIEEICTENALRFTAVISMRQDYLAQLDDLRFQIPSINSNRYRIRKFNSVKACDAIVKPAKVFMEFKKSHGNFEIIDKETAEVIITQLKKLEFTRVEEIDETATKTKNIFGQFFSLISDLFKKINNETKSKQKEIDTSNIFFRNTEIDPTILSLYCYQLYTEGKSMAGGLHQVELIQAQESPADEIIKNYYKKSLGKRRIKLAVENCLITPDGRRVLMPLKDFLLKSGTSEEKVTDLIKETGILRTYGEGNQREIELAHDQIAKRALISKREREANSIKKNAAIFLITGLTIIILGILVTANYVQKQKSDYTVTDLRNERDKLASELSKLSNTVAVLETDKISLQTRYEAFDDKLSSATRQISSLQTDNSNWQKRNKTLRDSLNMSNRLVNSLQTYNSTWSRRYNSQGDSLRNYISRSTQLTSDLNKSKQEITALGNENSRLKSEILYWERTCGGKKEPSKSNSQPQLKKK